MSRSDRSSASAASLRLSLSIQRKNSSKVVTEQRTQRLVRLPYHKHGTAGTDQHGDCERRHAGADSALPETAGIEATEGGMRQTKALSRACAAIHLFDSEWKIWRLQVNIADVGFQETDCIQSGL